MLNLDLSALAVQSFDVAGDPTQWTLADYPSTSVLTRDECCDPHLAMPETCCDHHCFDD